MHLKNQNYGVLYNWYAITDKRGLIPEGFQLPNSNDWQLLIDFCDGKEEILKIPFGWGSKFLGSNEAGFNAVNHGSRSDDSGRFIKSGSWYWSETEHTDELKRYIFVLYSEELNFDEFELKKQSRVSKAYEASGASIRLIKK